MRIVVQVGAVRLGLNHDCHACRAGADIFDDIEMFYNRARRHSHFGGGQPGGV